MEGWAKAIEESKIDIKEYTRERAFDEALAWDFIDFGVRKEYLLNEYQKALKEEITPPCKSECQYCGASAMGECRQYEESENA